MLDNSGNRSTEDGTNKITGVELFILVLVSILSIVTLYYAAISNSDMAIAMATLVLVVITGYYAWNTRQQVSAMKDQTGQTVSAMRDQVTAIRDQVSTMKDQTEKTVNAMKDQASIMQDMENRKKMEERKLRMQQIYTQLEGAKNEILDLYMSLIQSQLECVRLGFTLASVKTDPDQKKRITDEYYRRRQISDTLIIEVIKSTSHLIKILSLVGFYFKDVKEIDVNQTIKNVITNQHKIKDETAETCGKVLHQFQDLQIGKGNIAGEDLQEKTTSIVETQVENLFRWINTNIISYIDQLQIFMKQEIDRVVVNPSEQTPSE